jgi:Ion channel
MAIDAPVPTGSRRWKHRRVLLRRLAFARRNRCSVLLAMLCTLIVLSPLIAGSTIGGTALVAALVSILVVALWALRVRRRAVLSAAILGFIAVDAVALRGIGGSLLVNVSIVAMTVTLLIVTVALLKYVLDWHVITVDKVFGAISAYVLIAFTFASLFALLQVFEPHAFAYNEPDGYLSWVDLMYFSFTVLTSTGFGEITPRTGMARSFIILEQIVGVMYVAFLVARLANLYGLNRAPK